MADGARTRELAQRLTSGVEIVLLWHPGIDSLELVVHDPATGADCQVEIAPEDAIDAFYHPYAYAPVCGEHAEDEAVVDHG